MSGTSLVDRVARSVASRFIGTRGWSDAAVIELVGPARGQKILEIGSGRQDMGENAFSLHDRFPHADFVQSDLNPAFGHRVVDVTDMQIVEEFDVILCMYVLEHVFDVGSAIENMHRALRPGGRLVVAVPAIYPYHDEPIDFWRFTEHSLRMLCTPFASVEIRHKGPRRFPRGLLAVATR